MKRLLIFLLFCTIFASCDTIPEKDTSKKKVLVQRLYFSDYFSEWRTFQNVEVTYVDTFYSVGDTILIRNRYNTDVFIIRK